jgi:hypothetical protein
VILDIGLIVDILYGTLWSMMAMNTIISTPAWSVVAAAPSATPSAVHRRRDDLKPCSSFIILFSTFDHFIFIQEIPHSF